VISVVAVVVQSWPPSCTALCWWIISFGDFMIQQSTISGVHHPFDINFNCTHCAV